MKVLVDSLTNKITGVFNEPLNFDISGHYVIDVSPLISSVVPGSDNSVPDLITAKNTAWTAYAETFASFAAIIGTPTTASDELIGSVGSIYMDPNVGLAAGGSSGVEVGTVGTSPPNKRVVVRPGGTILTNPISITGSPTRFFFHYSGFSLYRAAVDPANPTNPTPGPSKMLYGYDPTVPGFKSFQNSIFTVSVCQPTTPFSSLLSPVMADALNNFPGGATSIRLKFTNTSTIPYHLSDWVLVYK
jgi:hypothetical protein